MYISKETSEETDSRLREVIALADLKTYPESYVFEEFPLDDFEARVSTAALALVRDEAVWSQLVPSDSKEAEQFGIFRFHFPPGADNSGFVGWLATHFKRSLGTGVFVICGQNSRQGGIFDYWGYPAHLSEAVLNELSLLRSSGAGPKGTAEASIMLRAD